MRNSKDERSNVATMSAGTVSIGKLKTIMRGRAPYHGQLFSSAKPNRQQLSRGDHQSAAVRDVIRQQATQAQLGSPLPLSALSTALEALWYFGDQRSILLPDRCTVSEALVDRGPGFGKDAPPMPPGPIMVGLPLGSKIFNVRWPSLIAIQATPEELAQRLRDIDYNCLAGLIERPVRVPPDRPIVAACWLAPAELVGPGVISGIGVSSRGAIDIAAKMEVEKNAWHPTIMLLVLALARKAAHTLGEPWSRPGVHRLKDSTNAGEAITVQPDIEGVTR